MKKEIEGMSTAAQGQDYQQDGGKCTLQKGHGSYLCRLCVERDESTSRVDMVFN